MSDRVRAGASKAEIKEELLAVGWSDEEANLAYREGMLVLGVPLPTDETRQIRKSSSANVIINLFSFVVLSIIATALGTLFFHIIEELFPDPLSGDMWTSSLARASSIHSAMAALLIGFPLYVGALRIWFRTFREDEGRVESRLPQWLTYIVLLIASVIILADLIVVVFTFLQGEITWRFFLKALTLLSLAGLIFGFYFFERKKIQYHQNIPRKTFQIFGWSVAALIGVGIVLGFVVTGSPQTTRERGFDDQRESDLSSLATCIEGYAESLAALPASLDVLTRSSAYAYCGRFMRDPESGKLYEYRVLIPSETEGAARVGTFELCADFSLPSQVWPGTTTPFERGDSVWGEHTAGRSCGTLTARLGDLTSTVPSVLTTPDMLIRP